MTPPQAGKRGREQAKQQAGVPPPPEAKAGVVCSLITYHFLQQCFFSHKTIIIFSITFFLWDVTSLFHKKWFSDRFCLCSYYYFWLYFSFDWFYLWVILRVLRGVLGSLEGLCLLIEIIVLRGCYTLSFLCFGDFVVGNFSVRPFSWCREYGLVVYFSGYFLIWVFFDGIRCFLWAYFIICCVDKGNFIWLLFDIWEILSSLLCCFLLVICVLFLGGWFYCLPFFISGLLRHFLWFGQRIAPFWGDNWNLRGSIRQGLSFSVLFLFAITLFYFCVCFLSNLRV